MSRKPYFATQPQRCAAGETGLGGDCLACGAAREHLCQAPVDARPKPRRVKGKTNG